MRGEAIAVLDPSRVSSHLFRRGMGPRAEETAVLAGGVSVRIQHLGCEHFVERYAFVVPGEVAPAASLTRLGELLKSLPVREGRAVNMSHWSELLAARAAVSPPLGVNTGEEIVVVPDFSWLSVNVKPVPGGKTELELVYDIAL